MAKTRDMGKVMRHAKNSITANTRRTGDAAYTAKSAAKEVSSRKQIPVGKSAGVGKAGRDVRYASNGTLTSPKGYSSSSANKMDKVAAKNTKFEKVSPGIKKSADVASQRRAASIKRQTTKKK